MRLRAGLWALGFQALARGALATVLSLLLLEKGMTMTLLPAAMALYSAVALLAELPSGFLADLAGRRRTFLAAQVAYGGMLVLMLAARGPAPLLFAMALFGVARALSSGSMEALVVELSLAEKGPDSLPRVTMMQEVFDTGGMALGALVGGVLHWWGAVRRGGGGSRLVLGASLAFTLAALGAAALFTREPDPAGAGGAPGPGDRLALAANCFREGGPLPVMVLSAGLFGWLLGGLETYWQPRFAALLPGQDRLWLLGVLGGGYYLAAVGGSILAERLLRRFSPRRLFGAGGAAAALAAAALALTGSPAMFFLLYLLLYFLIALPNMAQTVILNQNAPGAVRATLLSGRGLVLQLGGLGGNAFAALAVGRLGVPGLWLVSAALFAAGTALAARRMARDPAG